MNDAPPEQAHSAPLASTPVERLKASRARLRLALDKSRGSHSRRRAEAGEADAPFNLLDTIERVLRDTWTLHPLRRGWRVFRQIVGPAAAQQLRPIVTEHPFRVVAIAAGIGGLIFWLKPWRLLPRAALLSVLIPQRAIWQAVMASGLGKLADGDWLAQWVDPTLSPKGPQRAESDASDSASAQAASTATPTAPEHEVLHRMQPGADGARAA